MTKITIFSGFLGAGKTTLIKKLIADGYKGEKLVLIENEFGEIGIDGGFLQDAGIAVTEMNSGCICCSLVGDFGKALEKVLDEYAPDRILIEPSGVGKLSDVIGAVQRLEAPVELAGFVTVADAGKCKVYSKNFGEFYNDQIEHASAILLSRTQNISEEKLAECVALLRAKNPKAPIVTTPWEQLSGAQLMDAMEQKDTLEAALALLAEEAEQANDHACCGHEGHEHHHEHDHEHGEHCTCGCHGHEHEHDEEHEVHDHACCGHEGHEHHHEHDHEHGEHCTCGCHGHEHEHDEEHEAHDHACCGHEGHEHHHHHGHGADEVFTSFGAETPRRYTKAELEFCLNALDSGSYGTILRAKGIVPAQDGTWLHFDYVPGEGEVRTGSAGVTGRLCVIGAKLDEAALHTLFML